MKIRRAQSADANSVLVLYQSLIGTPGCTWHEDYPTLEIAQSDISSGSLYLLEDASERILAVASAVEEADLEAFECWDKQVSNWYDLSRVGVCQSAQGRGLAQALISSIIVDLRKIEGVGLRLLVSKDNEAAIALYQKLGFKHVGQCFAYGADWNCYELILSQ